MTDALYLSDSTLTSATAQVVEVSDHYLILDQTIFYPQGGGQPSDKGTISSDIATLNVKSVEYNGGNIKHVGTFKGTFNVGQKVELAIDTPLRHKHTQWHTAGHLVDLVARQLYPTLIPIRGMHGIGKKLFIEYVGVHELDLARLNTELTQLIANHPVIQTQFVTLEELKRLSNWLPVKLPTSKKLRILSIGKTYHIQDGGTQLRTGDDIWPITISQIEHVGTSTLVHYQVEQPKIDHSDKSHYASKSDISLDIPTTNAQFSSELITIDNQVELDTLYIKYLGKKGLVNQLMKSLQDLTLQDKQTYGPLLNELKKSLESQIETKRLALKSHISDQSTDLTIPGTPQPTGRLHPTTELIRSLNSFFRYHGFSVQEGPEIEDVEYNFRRLNLPEGHPATDLQDTLFVQEPNILLRTHTSSIQTRVLSTHKPPLRVVVPGKVYRNETSNATNSSFFYQYQGFVVDQGVNIGHLKDMLTQVHQFLFGTDVILRFRYKYYPEVSPGMGVDMQCRFCHGKGCTVCKSRGWIETLGSGMTHYNCYKACGIDPEVWTGYSFGLGLDRLVMSKYGISDIRKLYGGEIAYL